MTRPTKSLDPTDRLGVFKRVEQVPEQYRLHHHAQAYDGEDTWQAFCAEYEYEQGDHDRFREEVDRVGADWKEHMANRERHHALALPSDVEAWCNALLETKSERRTYDYWLRVNRFYDWLLWHTAHPHAYNPVLMAVVDGEAAGRVWAWKARKNRERRNRYERETDE